MSEFNKKAAKFKTKPLCRRQYFRLVTSQVSVWYADHSTPNPLVSLPDDVQVIKGNKFGKKLNAATKCDDQEEAVSKEEKSGKKQCAVN